MSGWIADASVLREPLRRDPSGVVLERLRVHGPDVVTAAPSWESLVLLWRSQEDSAWKRRIGAYLLDVLRPTVPVLPFDEAAATWLATVRAGLRDSGTDPAAGAVAAIAATRGLTVATLTPDAYAVFDGVPVEDWSGRGPSLH